MKVVHRSKCGSWLACDSGLSAYISIPAVTATYGSALTAGHFWKGPKVTKRPSPHHAAKPAFGQRGLTGRLQIKSRARRPYSRPVFEGELGEICGGRHAPGNHDAKRAALDLLLILSAPLNHAGRNSTVIGGVNRQGCRFSRPAPWMARGGGPTNHWRITGTPSPSEVPSGGARALLVTFGWAGIPGSFPKVTRCQSGPLSSRYRSNGYVHHPTVLTVRPPSQASQLPHWGPGPPGR